MNSILTSIYTGYEDVYFVHRDQTGLSQVADILKIDSDSIKPVVADKQLKAFFGCSVCSLVVIDVNSVGVEDTDYHLFLLSCFFPNITVVLVANDLEETDLERYLSSSVVEIFKGADPTGVVAVS